MFLRVQLTTLSRWLFAQKHSTLDAWKVSKYTCVQISSNNVLCHYNKRLIGYFKFLYGSGWFAFLWIFQKKLHLQHLFKSPKQRIIAFVLVNAIQYPCTLKNNIYLSNKRVPLPFFHSYTNPVFDHVLIHSFDKTHVLVVTVELILLLLLNMLSFNFVPLGWQDSEEAL